MTSDRYAWPALHCPKPTTIVYVLKDNSMARARLGTKIIAERMEVEVRLVPSVASSWNLGNQSSDLSLCCQMGTGRDFIRCRGLLLFRFRADFWPLRTFVPRSPFILLCSSDNIRIVQCS